MISKIDQVSTKLITIYELHNYDTSRQLIKLLNACTKISTMNMFNP